MVGLDGAGDAKPRLRADAALGDPWRKMSEADLDAAGRARASARAALDPWIKAPAQRVEAARDEIVAHVEPEPRREAAVKRGKLERRSPVVCESCGNESCECWRPRTPRLQRAAASLGAACTCDARSPRPSPRRLSPRAPPSRTHSDDESRPRRLYKSASQRAICATDGGRAERPVDPLLETTC